MVIIGAQSLSEIDRWTVGSKEVSLVPIRKKEQDYVMFKEGINEPDRKIALNVDGKIPYIREVVHLFHDVIADNLSRSIDSFAFIPLLTAHTWTVRDGELVALEHIKIGLFGQGNWKAETVDKAWWTLVNIEDHTYYRLEITDISGAVKEALFNLLCYYHPVNSYNERVRAVITFNPNDRVHSVALEILNQTSRFSQTEVALNRENWAITPVSIRSRSEVSGPQWCGHAMIAIEGVDEAGVYFMRYAHATKFSQNTDLPDKKKSQILIEKSYKNGVLPGPTIARSREQVELMLAPIQKAFANHTKLPFALGRQIPAVMASVLRKGFRVALITTAATTTVFVGMIALGSMVTPVGPVVALSAIESAVMTWSFVGPPVASIVTGGVTAALQKVANRYDCLKWALEQFPRARISFNIPSTIITPRKFIEYLNAHPEAIAVQV